MKLARYIFFYLVNFIHFHQLSVVGLYGMHILVLCHKSNVPEPASIRAIPALFWPIEECLQDDNQLEHHVKTTLRNHITHWGLSEMTAILQTKFSCEFSWK